MQKPYSFEVVDGISVVRFFKEPTLPEILGAMDEVVAKGVTRRRLWIFQFGANFTTSEIKKIAGHGIEMWPMPSRSAVVAPDDLTFGLARMHEVFREYEGLNTRVFRGEQEAIVWLNEE